VSLPDELHRTEGEKLSSFASESTQAGFERKHTGARLKRKQPGL